VRDGGPGPGPQERIRRLLAGTAGLEETPGARIARLSEAFLGTPYAAGVLDEAPEGPERLVVDLERLDCMTLLDYVEALRLCRSPLEFPARLAQVRYRRGRIAFETRNHFFLDWIENRRTDVDDLTERLAGAAVRRARKRLNRKPDGRAWVPGIPERDLEFPYLPSSAFTSALTDRLRSGDYIGIYTEEPGLDVSHVGIFIRAGGAPLLRHASSVHRKVLDEPFPRYIAGTPGLLVFRPRLPRSADE